MTLRIALRDGEQVVVNGAVLRSVGRTELKVENRVSILRGSDIMKPSDAQTPARQLYFHTMMAYIDPEGGECHHRQIIDALKLTASLLADEAGSAACASFARQAAAMNYYRALAECRALIAREVQLLGMNPRQAAA